MAVANFSLRRRKAGAIRIYQFKLSAKYLDQEKFYCNFKLLKRFCKLSKHFIKIRITLKVLQIFKVLF